MKSLASVSFWRVWEKTIQLDSLKWWCVFWQSENIQWFNLLVFWENIFVAFMDKLHKSLL